MADIRINALATTAASTASDDYIAIDGSANGTRKLNAYSPTFGGNLAANGTGAFGGTVSVSTGAGGSGFSIIRTGAAPSTCTILNTGGEIISDYNGVNFRWDLGGVTKLTLGSSAATLAGNLTVSGTGTSSFGGEPSTGAATHSGNLRIQSTGNGPAAVNGIELQNSQSGSGYAYKIYTNNSNDYLGIAGRFNSATWTEFAVFKQNTGNLLIGTTTDGGQKLQVNGTASFAGTVTLTTASESKVILTNTAASGVTWEVNSFSDGNFYITHTGSLNALQIAKTTGNATFAGGIIGMTQGNVDNISDDGVASFTPLYNRGFIVINNPDYSQNALIAYFKAGSSYLLYSITKSADVTLNNSTTLTGTTGTDGKLNIGYNNSIIYIENRLGGIGNFQRYALGGTNN